MILTVIENGQVSTYRLEGPFLAPLVVAGLQEDIHPTRPTAIRRILHCPLLHHHDRDGQKRQDEEAIGFSQRYARTCLVVIKQKQVN